MTTRPWPRAGHRRATHKRGSVPLDIIAGNDTNGGRGSEMSTSMTHTNCPMCHTEVPLTGQDTGELECPECNESFPVRPSKRSRRTGTKLRYRRTAE